MDKRFDYNGISVHYTVNGVDGQNILLMHGWGCNCTTLASIESALVDRFKVINVDFPGFGKSDEPTEVWGVEEYTRVVEALLKHENIVAPIMLGHSFGGRVGIVYASRNSVSKLILVDAAGVKPRRTAKYYFKVYTYKLIKRVLPIVCGAKLGGQLLDKYRGKSGSSDYNSASSMMRAILSKVVNEDLKHLMPKIQAPTLLIWGENDTATPLSDAKTMEQLIPDAGLVSFPDCGHYSFLDNPYQFRAVINSFLSDEVKQ